MVSAVREVLVALWLVVASLLGVPLTAAETEVDVRGEVADVEGAPLGVVQLAVTSESAGGFSTQVQTDSRGRFRLQLPERDGVYELQMDKLGYRTLTHTIRPAVLMGTVSRRLELSFTLQRLRSVDLGVGENGDRSWPNTAWDAYRRGLGALEAGRQDDARKDFLAALEIEPRFPPANSALAWFYLQDGELDAALAAADTFLRYQDRNSSTSGMISETRKIRLDALFALGDLEAALAAAETVLADEAQEPAALRIRYLCLYQLGRESEASQAQEALRGADSALGAAIHLHNQGVLQLRRGERAQAARSFSIAVELDPKLALAWSGLAKSSFLDRRYAPALEAADRLQQLEPDNLEALAIRYDSQTALGQPAQARPLLDQLAERDPTPETARRLHQEGFRIATLGDTAGAVECFRRAIAIDPELWVSYRALSTVLYQQGDYAGALAAAQQLLELSPADPQAEELAARARRAMQRR